MELVKVKDEKYLLKDKKSGAILNTNKKEIDEYHAKKSILSSARESKTDLNNIKEDIELLKREFTEIKELLKGLVK